jgi:hypothetical protein
VRRAAEAPGPLWRERVKGGDALCLSGSTALQAAEGDPINRKRYQREEGNDHMFTDTVLSRLTRVSRFPKALCRVWEYVQHDSLSPGGIECAGPVVWLPH